MHVFLLFSVVSTCVLYPCIFHSVQFRISLHPPLKPRPIILGRGVLAVGVAGFIITHLCFYIHTYTSFPYPGAEPGFLMRVMIRESAAALHFIHRLCCLFKIGSKLRLQAAKTDTMEKFLKRKQRGRGDEKSTHFQFGFRLTVLYCTSVIRDEICFIHGPLIWNSSQSLPFQYLPLTHESSW